MHAQFLLCLVYLNFCEISFLPFHTVGNLRLEACERGALLFSSTSSESSSIITEGV